MTTDQRQNNLGAHSDFGREGIAAKIAALLAKAESTSFDAERDALIAKAAALMARYQIDELLLNRASSERLIDDTIDKFQIVFDHTAFHMAYLDFMTVVGEAFGFKIVWRSDRKAGWWYGFRSDLKTAEVIYASLLIQVTRASELYKRTPEYKALPRRMDKHVAKRSFISGFGWGAARKIIEGRRTGEDEAKAEHGADNVLPVLASRKDELEEYFNETVMPGLGKSNKRSHRGDRQASGAGYDAGRRADIGQGRVRSNAGALSS